MAATHWIDRPDAKHPHCAVRRDQNRIANSTTELDAVTCRSCLRWAAHVFHDASILQRIYNK